LKARATKLEVALHPLKLLQRQADLSGRLLLMLWCNGGVDFIDTDARIWQLMVCL
jgi:hypothetical protein